MPQVSHECKLGHTSQRVAEAVASLALSLWYLMASPLTPCSDRFLKEQYSVGY